SLEILSLEILRFKNRELPGTPGISLTGAHLQQNEGISVDGAALPTPPDHARPCRIRTRPTAWFATR
ncbi:MAG: hypothetical protein WA889_21280, partial [Xanthobacteraceae bacterium]